MGAHACCGPIGGVLAERFDRRRLMITVDGGRAALMTVACVAAAADSPAIVIVAIATLAAALATPHDAAAVAATPLLVPEDDLVAANAAEATVNQLAWFIGPAVGALLVAAGNAPVALAVNAAAFIVSAGLIASLRDLGGGNPRTSVTGETNDNVEADASEPSIVGDLVASAGVLRRTPGLAALTGLLAIVLFAYGIEEVAQVLVAQQRLGMTAGGVGVLNACLGVGGLLLAPFAGRFGGERAGATLGASAIIMGLTLALLATTANVVVAGALATVEGGANITFDILLITLLQRCSPTTELARVYALQASVGAGLQLGGTLIAPTLLDQCGLTATLLIGGGALVGVAALILPAVRSISARTEAERRRLAPLVAQWRNIGVFDGASERSLERVARVAVTTTSPPGSTIICEGDLAEALFIIVRGHVSIDTRHHGHVRRLGPGDWFGEIGILRHTPRTASVTAVDEVVTCSIAASDFAAAIDAQVTMPGPLARTMATRLARTHPLM